VNRSSIGSEDVVPGADVRAGIAIALAFRQGKVARQRNHAGCGMGTRPSVASGVQNLGTGISGTSPSEPNTFSQDE